MNPLLMIGTAAALLLHRTFLLFWRVRLSRSAMLKQPRSKRVNKPSAVKLWREHYCIRLKVAAWQRGNMAAWNGHVVWPYTHTPRDINKCVTAPLRGRKGLLEILFPAVIGAKPGFPTTVRPRLRCPSHE